MTAPRILYLGQKPVGEACFDILLDAGVRPVGIVTNRDADRVWWKSSAIWKAGEKLGIPLLDNDRRRTAELRAMIQDVRPDVLLSIQHQWILPAEIISLVPRAFNLHLAPLPAYKGYNCFNHAILNGEKRYSVTLHHLVPEVDAGPIAFAPAFDIAPDETARSLYEKSFASGLDAFRKLLHVLVSGEDVPSIPPTGVANFYTRTSLDGLREVPMDASAEEKALRARALHFPPFPGAFTRVGDVMTFLKPR